MAKKTIHYVLSHCHALCASRHPSHSPRSLLHLPLVHSRAFAFEIIAAAFCMHSRWQLSGNGWTSASRAPSSELAREVAHKFHWACSGRVSSNSPPTDTNSQSQLLPPTYLSPLASVAMKPKPEPEPAEAEAEAETEAEAFTASRLSVYSHCYKLTNSLSPVKEKRGRVERGVVNALRTRV